MTEPITAIYEGGVLRPTTALPFAEGTRVRITVDALPSGPDTSDRAASGDEADRARREEAVNFIQALANAKGADDLPEDYDFLEALNENRRLSGDYRMLFPPEEKGKTW